jgi:hypothetical protein
MNLLKAWKKVLLFGLFGAVGCLAGWLVGEPYLAASDSLLGAAGVGQGPTLISQPTAPSGDPPPLPDDFRKRLADAKPGGAGTGDVQISLIWFDKNDLDLHCVDPGGFEIGWQKERRRSPTGGELDVDRNAGCAPGSGVEPVENIYWAADTAPPGDYKVYLNFYQQCEGAPSTSEYKINILEGGERHSFSDSITRTRGADPGPKKLIYGFRLEPNIRLFAPAEFELAPGRSVKVPVVVRRAYYKGPVEVRAENLPEGVLAGKLTIPESKNAGEIELKAAQSAPETRKGIKFVATGGSLAGSSDAQVTLPRPVFRFSVWDVGSIGIWTALLAVGLCLALLAGQNRYLGRPPFAPGRVPLAAVVVGAVAAGFVSGSIGQSLLMVFLVSLGVPKLGFLIGWVLLGGLLGRGMSYFVPNLDKQKATLAGLGGGLLGALSFWVLSSASDRDWLGRFGGAALLGFCIGLMVAVVEAAYRRAWLEVRFSDREVITVNLGPEPVKVGGDSRACTVWARGAAPVALRYWIRGGRVYCEDVATKREAVVADGDTRAAANVTVVVRSGGAPAAAPLPARPAPPPVPAPPPAPLTSRPAPALAPPPPPKAAQPDYDDGLPMPLGPPPPPRPAAASILDMDDYRAAAARPAPAPVSPTAAAPPAPSAPVAAKPAPPAAKPPVPGAGPAAPKPVPPAPKPPPAGDADPCPSCGRKTPGKPGARYCMVCDRTF